MKAVNKGLSKLSSKIDTAVANLNTKITEESTNPDLFLDAIISEYMPVNLTMSTAPVFSNEKGTVELHFDGRIVDPVTNTTRVPINNKALDRQDDKAHREQIQIHESMINSAFIVYSQYYMPKVLNNTVLSNAALTMFPEIKEKYGEDVAVTLKYKMFPERRTDMIKVSEEKGFSIEEMMTYIEVYVSNDQVQEEKAIVFRTDLDLSLFFSFVNFALTTQFNGTHSVADTKIVEDNVGLQEHDLDALFTQGLNDFTADYNTNHETPKDFTEIIPTLKFVNGLMQNTLLTTMGDEVLYGGFKWISDF